MHRPLALAVTLLAALVSTAHAQNLGSIQHHTSGSEVSSSVDVTTGTDTVVPQGKPTHRSDYPSGRLYYVRATTGVVPGTPINRCDHYLQDVAGNRVLVTDIEGPDYYCMGGGAYLVSNDGNDSFYSFWVYEPSAARYLFLRANITPWDVLAPDFVPLTMGDPRLELIFQTYTHSDADRAMGWNRDGTRVAYYGDYVYKNNRYLRLRIHTVGPDVTQNADELVNDERLSGIRTGHFDWSPIAEQLVMVTDAGRAGNGIAVWTPGVNGWTYAFVQKTSSKTGGLSMPSYPVYSPDGSAIAFWGRIYQNGGTAAYGIYRCPAGGGALQPVLATGTGTHILVEWLW